jgi:prefoldin subunit 5
MSDNKGINKLHLKIAALERRIDKLELGMQEMDKVIDPQGWIGQAFERVYEEIDEVETKLEAKIDDANRKLDLILQHLTGMNK